MRPSTAGESSAAKTASVARRAQPRARLGRSELTHVLQRTNDRNEPRAAAPHPYTFAKVPIPSIDTSTAEPGFIGNTPSEVPNMITSPGSRVIS